MVQTSGEAKARPTFFPSFSLALLAFASPFQPRRMQSIVERVSKNASSLAESASSVYERVAPVSVLHAKKSWGGKDAGARFGRDLFHCGNTHARPLGAPGARRYCVGDAGSRATCAAAPAAPPGQHERCVCVDTRAAEQLGPTRRREEAEALVPGRCCRGRRRVAAARLTWGGAGMPCVWRERHVRGLPPTRCPLARWLDDRAAASCSLLACWPAGLLAMLFCRHTMSHLCSRRGARRRCCGPVQSLHSPQPPSSVSSHSRASSPSPHPPRPAVRVDGGGLRVVLRHDRAAAGPPHRR
jgi:hypothetical protein